jgi:hypothetical protein
MLISMHCFALLHTDARHATKEFWGGKLTHSHEHTRRMLERNTLAAMSAPKAVAALVQDLSLPNSDWGFDLKECKVYTSMHFNAHYSICVADSCGVLSVVTDSLFRASRPERPHATGR